MPCKRKCLVEIFTSKELLCWVWLLLGGLVLYVYVDFWFLQKILMVKLENLKWWIGWRKRENSGNGRIVELNPKHSVPTDISSSSVVILSWEAFFWTIATLEWLSPGWISVPSADPPLTNPDTMVMPSLSSWHPANSNNSIPSQTLTSLGKFSFMVLMKSCQLSFVPRKSPSSWVLVLTDRKSVV